MSRTGSISVDVDSLSSIYKGQGCSRLDGYSFIEFRTGIENMLAFFDRFKLKVTMFMVGNDFLHEQNHEAIRAIQNEGHEIANHSMTHPQDFRWLSGEEKRRELNGMGDICETVTGRRPIGFRSPGWNIDDSAIPILNDLNYTYDSSVFPTYLMPLMKFAHWLSMSKQPRGVRTTMGQLDYMFAQKTPYRISDTSLRKTGKNKLFEFPLTVSPILRIPFFATLLLFTGISFYRLLYHSIEAAGLPVHFQMHLSDFIDYSLPELADQMPRINQGVYVPQALNTPLEKKLHVFEDMIALMIRDYSFITLEEWSRRITF